MCGHDRSPRVNGGALRRHDPAQRYGILTRSRRHVSKQVAVEPAWESANERPRALNMQSAALRLPEIQVAAPPRDDRCEWTGEAERLRIAWIVIAQGRFRSTQQKIAGTMTIRLQPNYQR